MKRIDWNKDSKEVARLAVSDGADTCYVSEDQLPEEFTLRQVAEKYAETYDHNGYEDEFSVCEIEDLSDDEVVRFAFDGHGNFEWRTHRQYTA
jgi:hypothetical protein